MPGECYQCGTERVYPEGTYDTAYPIQWSMAIQKVTGMSCLGICWYYAPDDTFGKPFAICDCGKALLEKARALEWKGVT